MTGMLRKNTVKIHHHESCVNSQIQSLHGIWTSEDHWCKSKRGRAVKPGMDLGGPPGPALIFYHYCPMNKDESLKLC